MNDIWILYLGILTWCKWDAECSFAPMPRYSHCVEMRNNTLIVFGGLSEENYCNSDVYALDLDGTKKVAIEAEDKKKPKLKH